MSVPENFDDRLASTPPGLTSAWPLFYITPRKLIAQNHRYLVVFIDTNYPAKSAQEVFQVIGAQIANQWLFPTLNTPTNDIVRYTEKRLYVQYVIYSHSASSLRWPDQVMLDLQVCQSSER